MRSENHVTSNLHLWVKVFSLPRQDRAEASGPAAGSCPWLRFAVSPLLCDRGQRICERHFSSVRPICYFTGFVVSAESCVLARQSFTSGSRRNCNHSTGDSGRFRKRSVCWCPIARAKAVSACLIDRARRPTICNAPLADNVEHLGTDVQGAATACCRCCAACIEGGRTHLPA